MDFLLLKDISEMILKVKLKTNFCVSIKNISFNHVYTFKGIILW